MNRFFASLITAMIILTATMQAQSNGLAQTLCDSVTGQPVTQFYNQYDDSTMVQLDVHEAVHRVQLAPDSTGTCAEKLARIKGDIDLEIRNEAPAYAAQLKYAVEVQHFAITPYDRLVLVMVLADAYHVTPGQIVRTFMEEGFNVLGSPPVPGQ